MTGEWCSLVPGPQAIIALSQGPYSMPSIMRNTAVLLVSCPDRKGLVAAIANFLYQHEANIVHADQHQDSEAGLFLMRVEWDLEGFDLGLHRFEEAFAPVAAQYDMRWDLKLASVKPRMAIFVSRFDHCLADLLYRWHAGELYCEIPLIISNHPDTHWLAEAYEVPFRYMPVTRETKPEVEAAQLALLKAHHVDFIVLARYMQVLSADFKLCIVLSVNSVLPAGRQDCRARCEGA